MSLKIWSNAQLSPAALDLLREGTASQELILAGQPTSNLASGAQSPEFEEADIAFGQPDPEQAIATPKVRWIQLSSAGYTRYDNDRFRYAISDRRGTLTNSSAVFEEPCAQHLLAFMLGFARQLPQSMKRQSAQIWDASGLRSRTRLLQGDRVLILGYGTIARRLIELLGPFRLDIVAFRRRPDGSESVPTYAIEELSGHLAGADHLVSTLPASPSTEGLLTSDTWAALPDHAVFFNIGRGNTLDQDSLIRALRADRLRGAYLDVVDPEPLPPDHELWRTPNCYITPHIGGGRADEFEAMVRHFLENLRRYEAGQPLRDVVFPV